MRRELKEKKEKEYQEKKALQEALEKELANDTYDENITVCQLLIEYCNKLLPKQSLDTNKIQDKPNL